MFFYEISDSVYRCDELLEYSFEIYRITSEVKIISGSDTPYHFTCVVPALIYNSGVLLFQNLTLGYFQTNNYSNSNLDMLLRGVKNNLVYYGLDVIYDINNPSVDYSRKQFFFSRLPSLNSFNLTQNIIRLPFYSVRNDRNDFTTNLYQELLDNSEQFQLAKSFLIDTDPNKQLDPSYWTDIQLKFFKFVEEYNKNVISLRATKKVNANVSGSIFQSGQQQDIDLSSLNANTARIANNLQMLDDNQNVKSITKVIDDKNNDQQVVVTTVEKAPYNPFLEDDEF